MVVTIERRREFYLRAVEFAAEVYKGGHMNPDGNATAPPQKALFSLGAGPTGG